MYRPGLKASLIFAALWLGLFLLLRQPVTDRPLGGRLSAPLLALMLAATITALYGALYFSRRAWRLADTPIARIRSAAQGYVELYGRAQLLPGPPILAPLSHLPCAWYRYQVEKRTSRNRWWPVDFGESDGLFLLDDGSAQCVIDPDGADFIKTRRDVWYGDLGGGRTHAPWGIGATYRYTEQRILPNEGLHVIGLFRTVGGLRETPDIRRQVAAVLESWKRDPRRMALFDRRGNGRIDPDEWEAARRAAHRHVQREQTRQPIQPDVHLMADPGDASRPFIIAAFHDEGRLIHYFYWRAALSLLAALLIMAYLASTFD